ncbi:manganese efflux pump MntP [Indioceanicola profundi]|uniref:manganese efflux pump MntP n=1 Tax=Indioceanicola profundi TaxID=2220096 RepID=UPI000E6AAADE|nr:manganese efflux pump MntP family protein [Indioceanicola profundi]
MATRKAVLPRSSISVTLGICQLLMPLLGWAVGISFADLVQSVDHWVAFILFSLIGGSMVRNALSSRDDDPAVAKRTSWLALLSTAVATSIDASAVGVGLAMADIDIAVVATLVGLVTFAMAFGGVLLGRAVGPVLGRRPELVGGLGLVAIGTKILLDHMDV